MRIMRGIDGIREVRGQEWGTSDWVDVTQDRVNQFADATDDHQWIHVDVVRAKTERFHGTIAHGYFTLALTSSLTDSVALVEGVRMVVNYGLNRVRFPNPIVIPARIRAHVTNLTIDDIESGVQVVNRVAVEVEGQAKPACVAETVMRYYA